MYFTRKRLKLYLWAMLVLEGIICLGYRTAIRSGAIDFRSYYTSGYMLRSGDGARLYDYGTQQRVQSAIVSRAPIALPLFGPPFAALLFVPLSYAPYMGALLLFMVVNLVLLAVAVAVMRPYLGALSERWRFAPALFFLSFLPVGLTLVMGQVSILVLLIDCVAFSLLESEQPVLAGLVFSIALIKLQTAIPVALLFLLWRRWRFVLGFLGGAAVLVAVSAWILGPSGLLFYIRSITHMSALAGTPVQAAVGVIPRAMANLYGLFFMLAPTNRAATALTIIASVVLMGWAATRRPSLPLALLVGLLVSYHLYPCDLAQLLLPLGLLCDRLFADDGAAGGRRRQVVVCSIGALVISPLMAEMIANNVIFLYCLPILALAVCPRDWARLQVDPPAILSGTITVA